MDRPTYRRARGDDVTQLVALRILMQKEANNVSESALPRDFPSRNEAYFRKALADQTYLCWVAETGDTLVATTGLVTFAKPPGVTTPNGLVGYVTNVYTAPRWRGQGLATDLMTLLVKHARNSGVDKLTLGATESGQRVYERVGFKLVNFSTLELAVFQT